MKQGKADVLPMRIKPQLMDLTRPVWKRMVYPLWLRWYQLWLRLPIWQTGGVDPGEVVYWRGVRLVCCTSHFIGSQAEHPWDPGWGWSGWKANALWEPLSQRDRLVLRIVGDPRRNPAEPPCGVER